MRERGREFPAGEFIAVDGVGNNGDLVAGDTAGDRIFPQALADRRHCIRAMKRAGLDGPGHSIPQARLTMGAVTCRRVLPKGAYFINDRNRMPPAGPNCRQGVEDRRVGVQYLRANLADYFVEFPVEIADDRELANPRQPSGDPGRHPGPQKLPFTDALSRRSRRVMLAAGQQHRLPAQHPLLVDNAEGAIDIAALKRQRMVEECSIRIKEQSAPRSYPSGEWGLRPWQI